jgi:septal ring factor EnvC (AmiA/AmiB activator)
MDKEKSIQVIRADFDKGERRGRIFNFVITTIVPFVVLITIFAGITSISSQYSSFKDKILSELSAKEATIEDKERKIEELKNDIAAIENENMALETKNLSLQAELDESKQKNKKLSGRYGELQEKYNRLRRLSAALMALENK